MFLGGKLNIYLTKNKKKTSVEHTERWVVSGECYFANYLPQKKRTECTLVYLHTSENNSRHIELSLPCCQPCWFYKLTALCTFWLLPSCHCKPSLHWHCLCTVYRLTVGTVILVYPCVWGEKYSCCPLQPYYLLYSPIVALRGPSGKAIKGAPTKGHNSERARFVSDFWLVDIITTDWFWCAMWWRTETVILRDDRQSISL